MSCAAAIAVSFLPELKAEAKKRQGQRTDLNIPPIVVEGSSDRLKNEAVAQAAA